MHECLIILSILACSSAVFANSSNKTHHCCALIQQVDAKANVSKAMSQPQGMPERTRRSIGGDRDTRAKFTKALFDTSSKEFLPARGRRSKFQKLKEMSSAENPFWAARGRRAFDSSNEDPFWAARGKKLLESSIESTDPFWAARGKKLIDSSDEKDDPFWAARGKKLLAVVSAEEPFWAARGKKLSLQSSSVEEDPFWAARGKKLESSGENPFWAARGKKLLFQSSAEEPFWAARGKRGLKIPAENPFWAARGKKRLESASAENPFYAARGRRSGRSKEAPPDSKEDPFYAPRGKRNAPKVIDASKELAGILKPRANRQPGDEFWPARAKKDSSSNPLAELDEEGDFWARVFGLDEDSDVNVSDVVAQILGIRTNTQKIKKEMGREAPVNPWYSTDFWATRG
ncbi:uncharacterized protein natalisin isoform X2 [Cloeon dipterum]|uniref:uncharacterized protein natalisin isoform X2 n=1 Tax=Cloeon dipterum TaxID=197152 RepID=UPI00321FD3C9